MKSHQSVSYLPIFFSSKAISAYFFVLAACLIFLPNKLPIMWIGFGIIEVVTFFYFSNQITKRWAGMPMDLFPKRLFRLAFIIRGVYVIAIYLFYQIMNGNPFEFAAGDSRGYHEEAIYIDNLIRSGGLTQFISNRQGVSDLGYTIYLSVLYLFTFKSIIIARLVSAGLGAWMCVLIYRLSQRTYGEQAARITAVMAMLLPTFIFYTGTHLKETVMVFVLVAFIERADYMLRSPSLRFGILMQVFLLGGSLFFFRTVLAAAAWFALFSALLFSAKRFLGSRYKMVYIFWFGMALLLILSGRIQDEVDVYIQGSESNQQARLGQMSSRGNLMSKYGSRAVFIPFMLPAPFPTLVYVAEQPNSMMINGNNFTRNIYVFFVIIALIAIYRRRLLSANVLILSITVGYMGILASSGFAMSERFHLPLVPFLLIFAGYGVTMINKQSARYYVPYLVVMMIIIVGWNWVKLSGRGII